MTSSDVYQLKWHSHSTHLNGSVAALLRSERFTDVVLCTMDGSQIPAHKFILSSCSVYLSSLFEGQRSVTRMGGMLYVVLPSEISTRALKILVEYMYKGETTVSNEVLDTVLKAGEVLKIRGLWRHAEDGSGDAADKNANASKQSADLISKKTDDQAKIAIRKDDGNKIIKTFGAVQNQGMIGAGGTRPMFIGPPKLVFIKTTESANQSALRPNAPKGQTILVAPAPNNSNDTPSIASITSHAPTITIGSTTIADDSPDEALAPRVVKKPERKYGKRQKPEDVNEEKEDVKDEDTASITSKKSTLSNTEVQIKNEPDWDASSIEEEERSIAEMFQAEMNVKAEPVDDMDIVEEGLMYSPLACELCAEVFTVPAAWVRHVQSHGTDHSTARRTKYRSKSDDTDETTALLRCDLCQKHFLNPAEWVRHIQSTHTESELALSNNRDPPKRHNRFTEGAQDRQCVQCSRTFNSHASLLIHTRTHTGEKPFVCGLCNKGFNVKSNLLRHLRTLHDQQPSPDPPAAISPPPASPAPVPAKRERSA